MDMIKFGIAGEYFVCADLLLQGFNAFPSGGSLLLPYDVIVEANNNLYKIQVKSSETFSEYKQHKNVMSYRMRKCRQGNKRSLGIKEIDFIAFVFFPLQTTAYLSIKEILDNNGKPKTSINFRTYSEILEIDPWKQNNKIKYFENYHLFERALKTHEKI